MAATIRTGTPGDLDAAAALFRAAFGGPAADQQHWVDGLDPERLLVADDGGRVAAASHVRPFHQWFGGRAVPLAGFSPVAVQPEDRGAGLGRAITAGQYPDLRGRGEVIAGLFPASLALYRAVGFEVAGSYVQRRLPAADLAGLSPSRAVPVRRGTPDDVAAVRRCYDRAAPRRDGSLDRAAGWWNRRLPADLVDVFLYVVDGVEGEVDGYAIFRHGRGRPPYDYSVVVSEVVADDPDHLRALWRVVASSGTQAPDLDVIGPSEDDLFLIAPQMAPTAVRSEIRWMLRLVDAAGAVAARGWPRCVTGRIELSITDPQAPWNEGEWILDVADGTAQLVPGGRGRVRTGIGGLSSWYAGYAPASRLARLGLLHASDRSDLDQMDRLLAAAPPVLTDFY